MHTGETPMTASAPPPSWSFRESDGTDLGVCVCVCVCVSSSVLIFLIEKAYWRVSLCVCVCVCVCVEFCSDLPHRKSILEGVFVCVCVFARNSVALSFFYADSSLHPYPSRALSSHSP